ncbi:MAG TPA: ABC transporter permease [Myxococcales bacterium]|nr:ABC transporter permease [Myxococcales bacterium]
MIPLSYNVRSILRRRFSAFATAFGLGLVVFVFAAVLMLARGVEDTLRSTGVRENAILLRKGSTSELTSGLPREAAKTFAADPAVAVEGGKQVASPELFVIFQLQRVDKSGTANVGIRGVTRDGWDLLRSKSIRLIDGRLPQWATSEIMVGRAARGRYAGAEIGQSITIARRQWQVVGIFDAGGAAFDSEIWADADQIIDASHRTGYSTMTVRLRSPGDLESLRATVDSDPRWNLEAKREDRFYEEASGQLATFIRVLGTAISIFFSFGATLGAMITMYAQVASRVREVGTLRALGFRRRSVLGSFLLESLILSLLGAVAGCVFASLLAATSFTTTNWSSFTEIKFRFHFAPEIALKATLFAVAMGLLGGLLPAARAARLQIAEAVKG